MPLTPGDPINFNKEWEKLKHCLDAIYSMIGFEGISASSFMSCLYKICIANSNSTCYAEKLYYTLCNYLESHVSSTADYLSNIDSLEFLSSYVEQWNIYSLGIEISGPLFHYLDNHWIRGQIYPDPLWESNMLIEDLQLIEDTDICYYEPLALNTWKDILFLRFGKRITKEIFQLIYRERKGEMINHSIICDIISSTVRMNTDTSSISSIYKEFIEIPYFHELEVYYKNESQMFIEVNGIRNYLKKALECLDEETKRINRYLESCSKDECIQLLGSVLIINHKDKIINEFSSLLNEEKYEDLHRVYLLLSQIDNGLDEITKQFIKYIKETGIEYLQRINYKIDNNTKNKNKNKNKANVYTQSKFISLYSESLINIYDKFNDIVLNIFNDNSMFVSSLEDGFRVIVNTNNIIKLSGISSAQYLSQYCDSLLRKNSSNIKMEEIELEKMLTSCVQLFKFIDDKDKFQKYYSIHLANRLIDDLSTGEEYEQLIIRGVQQISGMDYTSKILRMFQDINLTQGLNTQFNEYCIEKQLNNQIDLSVLVLTSGSWPLTANHISNIQLPNILSSCLLHFEEFYNSIHNGRRLTWIHNCSKGEIHASYDKVTYQITMPTYMIVTILLFNKYNILDYSQIQKTTNLNEIELNRVLKSLVVSRILIPDLKKLSKSTKFKVNSHFNHKTLKLKLGTKIQHDRVQESVTNTDITGGRKLLLQATIVRIMKMRKEIIHNQLIQEVIEQTSSHFVPEVLQIKKVIEILIDKEYIKRIDGENKYRYLA